MRVSVDREQERFEHCAVRALQQLELRKMKRNAKEN